MDRTRSLGVAVGIIRTGVGGALVVAPRWAGRIWVGPGADGPGSAVFARALGARDLVLGAKMLAASRSQRDTTDMLRLGSMADAADVAATLIAARHLEARRRVAMPLIAAAVGAAGVVAARMAQQADRDERDDSIETLSDEVRARVAVPGDVDLRGVDQARI
jgi:hypothetical protein